MPNYGASDELKKYYAGPTYNSQNYLRECEQHKQNREKIKAMNRLAIAIEEMNANMGSSNSGEPVNSVNSTEGKACKVKHKGFW